MRPSNREQLQQDYMPDGLKAAAAIDDSELQRLVRQSGTDIDMAADLLLCQPPISDALELQDELLHFRRLNAACVGARSGILLLKPS